MISTHCDSILFNISAEHGTGRSWDAGSGIARSFRQDEDSIEGAGALLILSRGLWDAHSEQEFHRASLHFGLVGGEGGRLVDTPYSSLNTA